MYTSILSSVSFTGSNVYPLLATPTYCPPQSGFATKGCVWTTNKDGIYSQAISLDYTFPRIQRPAL